MTIELICGDCLEVMKTLGKVDAVIVDAPYACGKAEWDTDYPRWLVSEAFKIAPLVCVMPGMWAAPECISDFGIRYKAILAGFNANGMTHGPVGFNNWIPAVVGGDVPVRGQDACRFDIGADKPDHPAPKPISFMLWLVRRLTDEGQTICDCMMGSGTTGVACKALGRNFIGIDIEPRYVEIARRRINATTGPLFSERTG